MIELRNDFVRASVAPALGGALTRFDLLLPSGDTEPVFRPTPAEALVPEGYHPNRMSCYPLVPWAGRLHPPELPTGTGVLAIPPTRADEPYPIHGWGWCAAWDVDEVGPSSVRLRLMHPGPPAFSATLRYALEGASLRMELAVENREQQAVGLGVGFHPWLKRLADGRLQAPARQVWLSGADVLPTEAVPPPQAWRFAEERALPPGHLDNSFDGWTGAARYRWTGEAGEHLLTVASDCDRYIVYAPAGRDFFCFEPISHRPAPRGTVDGLVMTQPGEVLTRWAVFAVG